MVSAARDIWQGHPASQAWKTDHSKPEDVPDLHRAARSGDLHAAQVLHMSSSMTVQSQFMLVQLSA